MAPENARLTITLFETEDVIADEALLKMVVSMLKDSPGSDEVRLVIRDTAGGGGGVRLPAGSGQR